MAIKQQAQSTKLTSVPRDYANMPTIPQSLIDRFPELEAHRAEQDHWWMQLKANITALESDVAAIRNKVNSG